MKKGSSILAGLVVLATLLSIGFVFYLQLQQLGVKIVRDSPSKVSSPSNVQRPVSRGVIPLEQLEEEQVAVSFKFSRSEGILRRYEEGKLVGTYLLRGDLPQLNGRYNKSLLFNLKDEEVCRAVGAIEDREVCARSIAVLSSSQGLPPIVLVEQEALDNPKNRNTPLVGIPNSLVQSFYAQALLHNFSLEIQ